MMIITYIVAFGVPALLAGLVALIMLATYVHWSLGIIAAAVIFAAGTSLARGRS